ncbi:MAG: hypothetical protein E6K80_08815 [Candidatus Eisenbacteria bacterium]|uniref:Lantibiotic dehydratase N-terminal domain-containing protein n=1 Tax=Eiseniibacteriota bacterium TaxID=2212470 RepID=A0A538U389_UNCEI|nr:MAG: hypothetical protein E6K80_08815 [Candidatus Eisenbacteria bacterium]
MDAGAVTRLALLRVGTLPFDALAALGAGEGATAARALLAAERALQGEATTLSEQLFQAAGPPLPDDPRARSRFALLRIRRDVHGLRAPRLADLGQASPFLDQEMRSRLHAFEELCARVDRARAAYEREIGRATREARRSLLSIAGTPLVEHGLHLASRSLLPKVRSLGARDVSTWTHGERHTAAKTAAYVSRFATKTSPNGVFCAVAVARIGGGVAEVSGRGGVERSDVLLSLSEARKVAACLAADVSVAEVVVPRVNPTLREVEGAWIWWKPASPRQPTDEEVHARAKDHPVLRAFVEEAAAGTRARAALVQAVAARTGLSAAELSAFLERLVDRGILIAEIEVPWSSRRRLRDLAAAARERGSEAPWIATLEEIERAVDALPATPFAERAQAMDAIARRVESLPRQRPWRPDELFRVDSAAGFDVRLPQVVLDELGAAMANFTSLLAAMYPEARQQEILVRRFLRHHSSDIEVPFLDVYGTLAETDANTDPPGEFGAGEGAPAVARHIHEWFVDRARRASPGEEVAFDLEIGATEPRWAAGVLFQVAAPSAADVSAGRFRLVLNGVFNGIGLALSRFAHLLQGGAEQGPIVDELRRAWSSMERPGAALAELTFNHEARTANAGLRPLLFGREIELPGDLVSPGAERHPLSDLTLRYDSSAERLVLRSRSRDLEIVPALSSGVTPSGIVSTLIHIGRQGMQPVGWLPGFHAEGIVHWPRFTCGRVVLFRERWVFRDPEQWPELREGATTIDAEFFLATQRWRERHGLPRHAFVHTSRESKPFYVDLESPLFVDLLRRALHDLAHAEHAALIVSEMLPGPLELWVTDEAGAYASEFLVQMEGAPVAATLAVRACG